MKDMVKRILSVALSVVMIAGMIPIVSLPVSATATIEELKAKYPHNSKWYDTFDGSKECSGFARLLCYEAYDSEYYINNNGNWKKITDPNYIDNGLKAGDLVRYKNDGHSVFITGVYSNTVSIADCNSDNACTVKWRDIDKSALKNSFTHAYSAPYALDGATPSTPPTPQNRNTCIHAWISDTEMGDVPTKFEKDKNYYLCYKIYDSISGDLYNTYADGNYSVQSTVYDSSNNIKFQQKTPYENSDYNWIMFTPDTYGTWNASITVEGAINGDVGASIYIEYPTVQATSLDKLGCVDWGRYTGNMGDSCIFNLDGKGLIDACFNKPTRNGNVGVDGSIYENGFEAWVARWNGSDNISWVYKTISINESYVALTGETGLIKSYNTTNFDTTVYFYGDGALLHSIQLTPDNYNHSFNIDVTGVNELKILLRDNKKTGGGTSFALHNLFLHLDGRIFDANADGTVNLKDAMLGIDQILNDDENYNCPDLDGDNNFSLADLLKMITYISN